MKHIVYSLETKKIIMVAGNGVGVFKPAIYKTKGPCTRLMNKLGRDKVALSNTDDYYKEISPDHDENGDVLMVERINIMSGKPFMEAINTPSCCSPASERYWSM